MRRSLVCFGVVLLLGTAARGVSLSDLTAGGDISGLGLVFSSWSLVDVSDVPVDPSQIQVNVLPRPNEFGPALRIDWNLDTAGDLVELLLSFQLTAEDALVGTWLDLLAPSADAGSVLQISADIGGIPLLVDLANDPAETALPGLTSASVTARILIDDTGSLVATVWRFRPVPEPGTGALLLLGLAALGGVSPSARSPRGSAGRAKSSRRRARTRRPR